MSKENSVLLAICADSSTMHIEELARDHPLGECSAQRRAGMAVYKLPAQAVKSIYTICNRTSKLCTNRNYTLDTLVTASQLQ
jgi:hypothetical protein